MARRHFKHAFSPSSRHIAATTGTGTTVTPISQMRTPGFTMCGNSPEVSLLTNGGAKTQTPVGPVPAPVPRLRPATGSEGWRLDHT